MEAPPVEIKAGIGVPLVGLTSPAADDVNQQPQEVESPDPWGFSPEPTCGQYRHGCGTNGYGNCFHPSYGTAGGRQQPSVLSPCLT